MVTQKSGMPLYRKYLLEYVRELMSETLTSVEEKTILLHCGLLTGSPISFSEISRMLQLCSSDNAEELYCQAVRKVREAIPGSNLEMWFLGYRVTYCPLRRDFIYVDPDMHISKWT